MPLFCRPAHRRAKSRSLLCAVSAVLLTPALCSASLLADNPPAPTVQNAASHPVLINNQKPAGQSSEEWVGMYVGGQKAGYSRSRTTPVVYKGKPAQREIEFSTTHITVFGATVEENSAGVTIKDIAGRPLNEVMDTKSNGSATHFEATFDYATRKIVARVGQGKSAFVKTIVFPANANFGSETDFVPKDKLVAKGQKFTTYTLDPTTIALRKIRVEIIGQETVRNDAGQETPAFVARVDAGVGDTKVWATSEGDMVKAVISVGPLAITMVKETKEHALDTAYLSPALSGAASKGAGGVASGENATASPANTVPLDIADATAISVDKPISDPRRLRVLKLRMEGLPDAKYLLSDARQQEQRDNGTPSATPSEDPDAPFAVLATIRAETEGAASAARLPVTDPALVALTRTTPYLDTNDASIQATAKKLRGSETNLYRIASTIRDWVHGAMTPDPSIGVPRSATDIYARRRGVCRDFATLFTALARAAGVPTRICSGIVYGQGKFYYHAWAECWTGKWTAFDPTLYDPTRPVPYVDATHIKFAQGGVPEMYDAVGVIGKLKLSILDSTL